MMGLWLLVLGLQPAAALCPTTPQAVEETGKDALTAYENLDLWGFRASFELLSSMLECVDAPITESQAQQIHQAYALAAWLDADHDAALTSWRASVVLDPSFALSEDIAPAGSRIGALFESARMLGAGRTQAVNAEDLVVDGQPGRTDIPLERASVVQRSGTWGTESWYLRGEVPQALLLNTSSAQDKVTGSKKPSSGLSPKLLLLAGISGIGTGLTARIALSTKEAYFLTENDTLAERYYRQNQAAGISSYVMGTAAVGLTTTALLVGRW